MLRVAFLVTFAALTHGRLSANFTRREFVDLVAEKAENWPWPNGSFQPARVMYVNLDLPPFERFREMGEMYKDHAMVYVNFWREVLDNIPKDIWKTWQELLYIPDEYLEELRGYAHVVNDPNLTMEVMISMQVMYELASPGACSAILAATPDGTVMHTRNLDYRKVAPLVDAVFMRGGKRLFSTAMFVGGGGVHTGIREGETSYTIEQNTRFMGDDDVQPEMDMATLNLREVERGTRTPFIFITRKMLETIPTFKEAVDYMMSSKFIAPQYFTMAGSGPWEAAIITVDRGDHMMSYQSVQTLSPQIDRWYIVQTNDDAWNPDASDTRRANMTEMMNALGQENASISSLLHIMRTPPVGGPDLVLQWTAIPARGQHELLLAPAGQPQSGPQDNQDWGDVDEDMSTNSGFGRYPYGKWHKKQHKRKTEPKAEDIHAEAYPEAVRQMQTRGRDEEEVRVSRAGAGAEVVTSTAVGPRAMRNLANLVSQVSKSLDS